MKAALGREARGEPVPVPRALLSAAPDERLRMASALGNQAFGALVAGGGGSPFVAHGVVARQPTAPAVAPATASWNAPLEWGLATQTLQARSALSHISSQAQELLNAGFSDMAIHIEEATSWSQALAGEMRPLTAHEAEQLAWFGRDFEAAYRADVQQVAQALVQQLTGWLGVKPISDEDLFDLRETVHHQFVRGVEPDVLATTSRLLEKTKELLDEVGKWAGYGAKAKDVIAQAKRFEDIKKGVKEVSDKVEEVKKVLDLARDIGRMTGTLGQTPAGVDDIGALEGALNVMDFAVSKLQVPGFKQLWDGYIFKAAKICVAQLRQLKELLYRSDREGGIRLFFEQHRRDAAAPAIKDAFFHGIDSGQHFPGGQPMLNFMWTLMRDPDAVSSVPAGIEDYFVRWRDEMNAGAAEELESDSSISNLWNVFSRERAPNIVGWLKRNREDAWVKLYGGMPAPS